MGPAAAIPKYYAKRNKLLGCHFLPAKKELPPAQTQPEGFLERMVSL